MAWEYKSRGEKNVKYTSERQVSPAATGIANRTPRNLHVQIQALPVNEAHVGVLRPRRLVGDPRRWR